MERGIDSDKAGPGEFHSKVGREMHYIQLAEKHFSIRELSDLWNLSRDSVRRLFENEPGVVVFKKDKPHRRTYKTLRIPESVALRVYRTNLVVK
jgi:hypothetical protein